MLNEITKNHFESGFTFILENVENVIDPGLHPVVDKQIIMKGVKKKLMLGEVRSFGKTTSSSSAPCGLPT